MKIFFLGCFFLGLSLVLKSQDIAYRDSMQNFQKKYVATHEVVKENERKYFRFFPVNEHYKVIARFEKTADSKGFIMKTSGTKQSKYFRYGILHFNIDTSFLQLTVYQSEQLLNDPTYKDYLFVPYTDLTSGEKSYGGGKYLDFLISDIQNNSLVVDFNKAYNPYCAYATGYNCPIPPRENNLPVAIEAGEMDYAKKH